MPLAILGHKEGCGLSAIALFLITLVIQLLVMLFHDEADPVGHRNGTI